MCAAVQVTCRAVRFEVGIVATDPFEDGCSSVVGSCVGILWINFCVAAIILMNKHLCVACGRFFMYHNSSCNILAVCSAGVSQGAESWLRKAQKIQKYTLHVCQGRSKLHC